MDDTAYFRETSARMYEDPNLTGDVLLLAQATLYELIARRREGKSRGRGATPFQQASAWRDAAMLIHPDRNDTDAMQWARNVIGRDAPRYEIPRSQMDYRCDAPMIRREGACGKPATTQYALPSAFTGERTYAGHCARHKEWGDARFKRVWDTYKAAGSPVPANNTGGALMPYFDTDWPRMYTWAAPYRYRPDKGTPPEQPPKARLALVTPLRRDT